MLVLSRKIGEKIVIGQDITITITEVSGGRVKVGIEAPRHVAVLRGELAADAELTKFRNQWDESAAPEAVVTAIVGDRAASINALISQACRDRESRKASR